MFYWRAAHLVLFAEPAPLAKEEPKPKSEKAKKKAKNGSQVG